MIWAVLTAVWSLALASLIWSLILVVSESGFEVITVWPMLWMASFVVGLLGGIFGRKKLRVGCILSLLACSMYIVLEDFHGFHLFWKAEHIVDVLGFYSRHPRRAFDTVILPVLVVFCAVWVVWHWRAVSVARSATGSRAGL